MSSTSNSSIELKTKARKIRFSRLILNGDTITGMFVSDNGIVMDQNGSIVKRKMLCNGDYLIPIRRSDYFFETYLLSDIMKWSFTIDGYGDHLWHLDGDMSNFSISNLALKNKSQLEEFSKYNNISTKQIKAGGYSASNIVRILSAVESGYSFGDIMSSNKMNRELFWLRANKCVDYTIGYPSTARNISRVKYYYRCPISKKWKVIYHGGKGLIFQTSLDHLCAITALQEARQPYLRGGRKYTKKAEVVEPAEEPVKKVVKEIVKAKPRKFGNGFTFKLN